MEVYKPDEFFKFISVVNDIQMSCLYNSLYYCRLRRGELRGLQWKDINFKDRTLSITKQINDRCGSVKNWRFSVPKTKSSIRILKMPQVLTNDLKMMKNEADKIPVFNDEFFVAGDMLPVCSNTLTNHKNVNCKLANVKQIRLHDFRHSCASLLVNNEANITVVAKYFGHTKIEETLNTYTHLFNSALNEVVSIIDSLEDNI